MSQAVEGKGYEDMAEFLNKIAKKTLGKDHDTYQLATHILGEEISHEEMFENLKER